MWCTGARSEKEREVAKYSIRLIINSYEARKDLERQSYSVCFHFLLNYVQVYGVSSLRYS